MSLRDRIPYLVLAVTFVVMVISVVLAAYSPPPSKPAAPAPTPPKNGVMMHVPKEQEAKLEKNRRDDDSPICMPCMGPSLGFDGRIRLFPSFSPGIGF